ncbi:LTA synthase family protein [Leucobacter luti]|uniref:LTA synthase family protein n=1 Tax=Leucobacter luti TaxID=340320 RepID=UPI003D0218B8
MVEKDVAHGEVSSARDLGGAPAARPETGVTEGKDRPRKKSSLVKRFVFWALMLIGALLLGISLWVRRSFGFISVDQLLSNMQGGGGEGAGGDGIVVNAVITGIVLPVLIVAALMVLSFIVSRKISLTTPESRVPGKILTASAVVIAIAVPLAGGAHLSSTIGLRQFVSATVREAAGGSGMAEYYVSPMSGRGSAATVGSIDTQDEPSFGPGQDPRNLVVIYLESVEDAFSDTETFEIDMLEPVEDATRGWTSVPNFLMYEGGGWTMSGLVSTQCGIPLRTDESGAATTDPNELGSGDNEIAGYLPRATCLGDVLSEAGYTSVFLGGADKNFAGKGQFFSDHGYSEVKDLDYWQQQGETEIRSDWGLSDRRLFENAKTEIDALHAAKEPFNLTMLTLDTHEMPYAHEYCEIETEAPLASITFCSMQQVEGFIGYMEERGYLSDTAVVVMGDHPKMTSEQVSFWDELNNWDAPRTIFNRIWSPDGLVPARNIDQLSMYPTMLELIGLEVPDHRAGIGVSAFAAKEDVPQGSILDLSKGEYSDVVNSRSTSLYRTLWGRQEAVEAAG